MADIHIQRTHRFGLAKARKIAWAWAEKAEKKFDMECTVVEGDGSDTVEFKRSGVSGTLLVEADRFELNAKLGFLLGAFSKTIEAEITKNLDALLDEGATPAAAPAATRAAAPAAAPAARSEPAAKKAARKPRK